MGARVREAWERVKAAGIDVLTEGIRLAQTAGEHLLQQVAERQVQVPPFVHSALERFVGREHSAPRDDDLEFVCKPAGPDSFSCRPADDGASDGARRADGAVGSPAGVPRVRPKKAARRSSKQPPAKAAAPKRPRKKPAPPAPPPVTPPSEGTPGAS
jgi:hypothetical protein